MIDNTTEQNDAGTTIDTIIENILDDAKLDWKHDMLYSWNWGSMHRSYLNPRGIYDFDTFQKVPLESYIIPKSSGIEAELYEQEKKFLRFHKKYFILELKDDSANMVVTNIYPKCNFFAPKILHSEIGKWDVKLR